MWGVDCVDYGLKGCMKRKGRVIADTAFPFKQIDLQFDADYFLHNFFIYFPFVVYFFQLQYLFA
jgi:hypothetical protein